LAGLQHTWPLSDPQRAGLLPDSYILKSQMRDGPAINPGTLGSEATRVFGRGPLYDFRALRRAGLFVHAPGEIVLESETERRATFTIRGWPTEPYFVLVNGVTNAAAVKVNDLPVMPESDAKQGRLVLKLTGQSRVQIDLTPH
jgi:hypothetical protein